MNASSSRMPVKMEAPVPITLAAIAASVSMAGAGRIAARTLMTAPLGRVLPGLLVSTGWRLSVAFVRKARQVRLTKSLRILAGRWWQGGNWRRRRRRQRRSCFVSESLKLRQRVILLERCCMANTDKGEARGSHNLSKYRM